MSHLFLKNNQWFRPMIKINLFQQQKLQFIFVFLCMTEQSIQITQADVLNSEIMLTSAPISTAASDIVSTATTILSEHEIKKTLPNSIKINETFLNDPTQQKTQENSKLQINSQTLPIQIELDSKQPLPGHPTSVQKFNPTPIPVLIQNTNPELPSQPNFFEFPQKNQKKIWVENKKDAEDNLLALPVISTSNYTPIFFQKGRSSWYGTRFHGRLTASGKPFNMFSMTAAHRTLPLGTKIKVINPANNKQVTVEVNDRGPYAGNRVLDLSFAAAKALDLIKTGVAQVELHLLEPIKILNIGKNSSNKSKKKSDDNKKPPAKNLIY